MTDDPRLEAVVRAHARFYGNAETSKVSSVEGRAFYVMARAFLGEDAERKEVSDHTRGGEASADNATAPVAAGADPPWLDEAARAMGPCEWDRAPPSYRLIARHHVRAVLRIANAQPVTDDEVTAATNAICDRLALRRSNAADTARAALEAAAKVRAGG